MFFDQRGAGAEDGRESEKKPADGRSVAAADEAGEDGRSAPEGEADQILIPAALLAGGR
jgi:hypothetical protein